MKNLIAVFSVCCLLLCCTTAYAQCADGNCPRRGASVIPAPTTETYLSQYRNEVTAGLAGLEAATKQNSELLNKLIAIETAKAAAPAAPCCPCAPAVVAPVAPVVKEPATKVEAEKEKADALLQSPFAQHLAALLALLGVALVGHAVYKKCHADRAKIEARLSPLGKKLFDSVDDFNTAIDERIHGKLQPVKDDLVKVALATPAPSQVAAAPVK